MGDAAGLDGKPQVVLVGPAAEEPPGVPVDAGDVYPSLKVREAGGEARIGVGGQGLEGGVHLVLKFLLVGEKPGPLVVEGELPEERAGFFGEALKHGKTVFQ